MTDKIKEVWGVVVEGAKELAGPLGSLTGVLIAYAIIASFLYVVIYYAIGLKVTYLQVWGCLTLFSVVRNLWKG